MLSVPPSSQDPRTFAVIGAAYEVHRVLGAGFLERFYKDALAIEFALRDIPFRKDLASSKPRCGLLLNFGTSKLEHKRFIWEPRT